MTRGRRHVPPTTEIGVWFQHRGVHSADGFQRQDPTSTGSKCSGPQLLPVPPDFQAKSEKNYRYANRFSEHDNRNAFQNHGVYFGDGMSTRQLGRNLIEPQHRHHGTDKDYLKHRGREVTDFDYHSIYNTTYKGRDTNEPPTHRRFTKSLPPANPGKVSLTTATTVWSPTAASQYKTDTQILAVSQEPFPKHNPWQYSYHSKRNVYPPYDSRSEPVSDNMLNRYGAAFNTSSNFNSSGFSGLGTMETTSCS